MLLNPENCWWNNIFLSQIFQKKRARIFLALLFFKHNEQQCYSTKDLFYLEINNKLIQI